jgi:hypothetical protein
MFKESYASGPMKTHSRPGTEHSYSAGGKVEKFKNLKKKLKKG